MAFKIYKGKKVIIELVNPYPPPPIFYPFDGSITLDNLLIAYDCFHTNSYPGSGSTIFDVASNLYNGTFLNTPAYTSDAGGGLTFVRTDNDAINLGDTLDGLWTDSIGKFTVEFWLKFNTLNNNVTYTLFSKYGDSNVPENQRQFVLSASNYSFGGIRLDYFNTSSLSGGGQRGVRSNTLSLVTGNYYHIVMTYDASVISGNGLDRVNFYINNSLQSKVLWFSSGGFFEATANGTAKLGIGAYVPTTSVPYFGLDGNIYAFSLYNRVLTPTEITYNWNGKRARFGL